jgi:uncharacterized integral membrane protein
MKAKTIIILVLILLALIILIQNTQVVEFGLLFWKIAMSKILMLFIALVVGFLVGFLLRPMIIKKKDKRD